MDSWTLEGPQTGGSRHSKPCRNQLGVLTRTNVLTWESPSWHPSKGSSQWASTPSPYFPTQVTLCPYFTKGGANAYEAKRLLTYKQVDCEFQKKLLPGGWFLGDGVMEGKGDCGRCSHNSNLLICLVQATQIIAIDS